MTNRSYIRVRWQHQNPDEPIDLWSELDTERFETRKLEIFRDGRIGYASPDEECGGTRLGKVTVPSIRDIASDVQFEPEEVSKGAFENMWNKRHGR